MNRHFRKNVFAASDYFMVFVFIILFISCMTIIEVALYSTEAMENIGGANPLIFDRTTYENMTVEQRKQYLNDQHDGIPEYYDDYFNNLGPIGSGLEWIGIVGHDYWVFPDGYKMAVGDYNKFVNGNIDPSEDINILSVFGNALTLNFHVFEYLGIVGTIIRIFLISIFVYIIYLSLPFTG